MSAGIGGVELEHFAEGVRSPRRRSPAASEPLPVAEIAGGLFGGEFDRAAELFAGLIDAAHLRQQLAKVQQGVGVAGILPQADQIMLAGGFQLALAPEGLGDANLHVRISRHPDRAFFASSRSRGRTGRGRAGCSRCCNSSAGNAPYRAGRGKTFPRPSRDRPCRCR